MRLTFAALAFSAIFSCVASRPRCKCFPGDTCWPQKEKWDEFNTTVEGRLIATEPLGAPCHDPGYDEQKCATLREQWLYSGVHMQSTSSAMAPLFANQSCNPFTPREWPCNLGNYVVYTVNVSFTDDIIATLKFARDHDIRIVIRNTGHDYLGRSTGAGALAIWTHYLKETEILEWKDESYQGKALKFGAGVQGFEALAAVKEAGLVVVTGECPTVGVVGGYLQGAGHSGLSTTFGLAADNVLSFEVVTGNGEFLTASRSENQDLYWALAGGGGGTFGVVTSAILKAHPDAPVAGATFAISLPEDKLFEVIDVCHAVLPRVVDSGVMVIYFFGDTFLQVLALTAYNKTAAEVRAILNPFGSILKLMNATFDLTTTEFTSYHEHYERYWGPLPEGNIQVSTMLFGDRLIPRDVLSTTQFVSAAKQLANMGVTFIGVGTNVSRFGQDGSNAVLPQWRSSIVQSSLILPGSFDAPWEDMLATQHTITEEVQPVVEAATPGAGAYMNEADFQQQNWQQEFYGANYDKLSEVKKSYDPDGVFYVVAGVGSEDWEVGNERSHDTLQWREARTK